MQATSSKKISKDQVRAYYQSSSFKMAVLFTILLGACAVLLGFFLYDYGQKNFLRETEAAINAEIYHTLYLMEDIGEPGLIDYLQNRKPPNTAYFYQPFQSDITIGDFKKMPQDAKKIIEGVIGFARNEQGKMVLYAAKIHTFKDGSTILVARDITDIKANHLLLKVISAIIMLFMLMVILVSFFISNFVVSRTNIIAGTAKNIIRTGDLSRRISIDSHWDDLSNLAQILNALLDKIELLMTDVRNVTDNIAHDLRTPLTHLRNELQDARKKEDITKDDIDRMIIEADHLLSTFNSLLRITNIEKAKRHGALSETNLSEILEDVAELYEPLAEDKNIKIEKNIEQKIIINGDRNLLFQLFANLLDNAVKYSEETGTISVTLKKLKKSLEIKICDQGIGISDSDKEKVFDRFYRADKSRSKKGTGLGLSLVKAILELHDSKIKLLDNNPGVRVVINIPKKF